MGNLINVPIKYEFHFVDKNHDDKVSVTLKIRRLRRLRDVLNIGLSNCKIPEGSWRVSSFSALPLKLVDALERIRCSGTLVVYAESNENSTKNGVDLSVYLFFINQFIKFFMLLVVQFNSDFRCSLE